MIINHKYKFIFHKTKKTGGTSMEIALSKFTSDSDVVTVISHDKEEAMRKNLGKTNKYSLKLGTHSRVPELLKFLQLPEFKQKDIFNSYFKFTILRDPVDTFISEYFYLFRNPGPRTPNINQWIKNLKDSDKSDVVSDNWGICSLQNKPIVDDYIMYSKYSGPGSTMYNDCVRVSKKLQLPENLADIFYTTRAKTEYIKKDTVFLNKESLEFIEHVSKKQIEFTGEVFDTGVCDREMSVI